jgi:alkanesulfonate monooxygenase SsuD/methylene tetrahydromethanopterin reductase-like flavin-dependent oxidoreductase (luciferase family)
MAEQVGVTDAAEPSSTVRVGVDVHDTVLPATPRQRNALLGRIAEAGLEFTCVADHVSFQGGGGFDGMVAAAAVLAGHPDVDVLLGVYQAALRHPLVTARALSSLAEMGPGRVTFGVGVGGEDRLEVTNCGVDPRTRGRRLDEILEVLGKLASGEPVDHSGEFFTLEQAAVVPAPATRVPIVVGGSSEAAIERTARFGDGWLGIFCTPRRFGATAASLAERADAHGRAVDWLGMNLWCGVDDDADRAREHAAATMSALYGIPFEKFERVVPVGTAKQVAEVAAEYVHAGARHLTIIPAASSTEAGIDHAAEIRARVRELTS